MLLLEQKYPDKLQLKHFLQPTNCVCFTYACWREDKKQHIEFNKTNKSQVVIFMSNSIQLWIKWFDMYSIWQTILTRDFRFEFQIMLNVKNHFPI